MSYDAKCYDLAAAFLRDYTFTDGRAADSHDLRDAIAQDIQDAIEGALEYYGLIEK